MAQVLIVTTNHDRLGDTGKPTGLWISELAEPYYALIAAGHQATIASPNGGNIPFDPKSLADQDAATVRFLADDALLDRMKHSVPLDGIDAEDFAAIFLPGGHGPMWDLADNAALARLLTDFDAAGKPVAAVCHGPAGLVSAKRADGMPLIAGRTVAGFTNAEEDSVGLTKVVPFLLEDRLRSLGARYEMGAPGKSFAVRDGTLITGQNPASAGAVGERLVAALAEA
ncbi:putative intracellular protease/amidase [Humitalea rosea]|uniref:Putative intracellular protease/amidase n=1 Tax=Humitalea rosea TaxID=990373 RepID=A0A2W7I7K3_9PROT|nr:type 1 glutamine amidotransferase domain-containing protein [Humitalea rosea]PZW42239.1 putative intracellular protease/amidase [Humitalea rosea]